MLRFRARDCFHKANIVYEKSRQQTYLLKVKMFKHFVFICVRYLNVGGDVPIGDAFKLYWHFYRFEKNGAVGIVLTVFLYIVTIFTSPVVLYFYFLRVHNNGRLMDVYHRLHAREDEFFIPYDLEISNVELSYVCKKAEQFLCYQF